MTGEPDDTETVLSGSGRGGGKRPRNGTSPAAYFIGWGLFGTSGAGAGAGTWIAGRAPGGGPRTLDDLIFPAYWAECPVCRKLKLDWEETFKGSCTCLAALPNALEWLLKRMIQRAPGESIQGYDEHLSELVLRVYEATVPQIDCSRLRDSYAAACQTAFERA